MSEDPAKPSGRADAMRQVRLLWRHVKHAPALVSERARAARTTELVTLYAGANRFLRDLGVEYALYYGTLLGWHREGRMLAHDRDVDFAAPVSDYEAIRRTANRLPAEFTMRDTSHRHNGPKLYLSYRGWEADIYFLTDEGAWLRPTLRSPNPGDVAPIPRAWYFPRERVTFHGEETFVPARPKEILEQIYGYIGANAVFDRVTRYYRPR